MQNLLAFIFIMLLEMLRWILAKLQMPQVTEQIFCSGNYIVYDSLATGDISVSITNSLIIHSGYHKCGDCPYGGGLTLLLGNSRVSVDIINTNLSRNSGCLGGNMAVLMTQFASVTISHVNFNEGHADK